jgi:hypothetical protein
MGNNPNQVKKGGERKTLIIIKQNNLQSLKLKINSKQLGGKNHD